MIDVQWIITTLLISFLIIMPVSLVWKLNWWVGLFGSLFIGLVSAILMWILSFWIGPFSFIIGLVLDGIVVIICTVGCIALRFFRDPERRPPEDEGCILSPADGCIRYIKSFSNGEIPIAEKHNNKYKLNEFTMTDILDDGGITIGIEMNILDVHVNRSPIPGRVQRLRSVPGPFLSLKKLDAIFLNERVTTVIENAYFRIGVVQIASRLVRRIVSYVSEGDRLDAGQRIGMIRFGSQVDLIIPKIPGLKVNVTCGQKVQAGTTVLAVYINDTNSSSLE